MRNAFSIVGPLRDVSDAPVHHDRFISVLVKHSNKSSWFLTNVCLMSICCVSPSGGNMRETSGVMLLTIMRKCQTFF